MNMIDGNDEEKDGRRSRGRKERKRGCKVGRLVLILHRLRIVSKN